MSNQETGQGVKFQPIHFTPLKESPFDLFANRKAKIAARNIVTAAMMMGGTLFGMACEATPTPGGSNTPEPTRINTPVELTRIPTIQPTERPTATLVPPTRTAEKTVVPIPTPTAVLEMGFGINEMGAGGFLGFLEGYQIGREGIIKSVFDLSNPGMILLTPEGETEQYFVNFAKEKDVIAGNFNLPTFPEGSVNWQPAFNGGVSGLMTYRDNQGMDYYHVPLAAGKEGQALVVYMKGRELYDGFIDTKTGKLISGSEKPYWVPMPKGAIDAKMVVWENSVYVVFLNEGKQLIDEERIKLFDLPVEATPTPEPKPTVEQVGVESKFFKAEFAKNYNVVVDNIPMNITIGLEDRITNRPLEPVKSFEPAQPDAIERVGKFYLQMCFMNYKKYNPGNDGLSFEQYENIVRNGGGEITIAGVDEAKSDNTRKREILKISPKKLSLIFAGGQLPVTLNANVSTYLGKNSEGLVIVTNFLDHAILSEIRNTDPKDWPFNFGAEFSTEVLSSLSIIGVAENNLLLGGNYMVGGKFSIGETRPYRLEYYSRSQQTKVPEFWITQ